MRATIGIHLIEDEELGLATAEYLSRWTNPEHPVVMLREAEFEGGAAGFNLLCAQAETDAVVLLEGGCLPGPGWLEALLETLEADPSHGLAGPSTNRCWNEQAVFPRAQNSPEHIAASAREAELSFGKRFRTLEPLYSLSDFCYAVRREVWEDIGGADEEYGAGPCWEMDFNVRAARAGFKGLWVCGSYVYRAPEGPRRRGRESLLFETNKRRYQDKFCGRQLRQRGAFYRQHCSGDACPNFAPIAAPALPLRIGGQLPLVTCAMPTSDRRRFVPESIAQFLAQDYPRAELLILDDGPDLVEDLVPRHTSIRYVRLPEKLAIGKKRNAACELARGEYVAHWDDDDWYAPWRLTVQMRALLEANAELCGTSVLRFFDPGHGKAFEYTYGGSDPWLAGNSMLYRKTYWERHPFEDVTVGEDALFARHCWTGRMLDLKDPELALARLHHRHTSPKHTAGLYWRPIERGDVEQSLIRHRLPLVSCVMPTRNRHAFFPVAYDLFRAQDYPRLELVIIDDSDFEPPPELYGMLRDPRVRYLRVPRQPSLGEKRNLACRAARGEIIIHWDDDDWYGRTRVSHQVAPILNGEADITGLVNSYTLDLTNCQCWTCDQRLLEAMFVGGVQGGTLAFRASILGPDVSYPPANLAEDAGLLNAARAKGARFVALDNPGLYVYVRHGQNTWQFQAGRFINQHWWQASPPPAGLDDATMLRLQAAATQRRHGAENV